MENKDIQDYPKFVLQKYSVEYKELKELLDGHDTIKGIYNLVMNQYKCTFILTEIPNFIFAYPKLQLISLWRIISNINELLLDKQHDDYILIKLNEALNLVLNGYQLTEQERTAICNVQSLPQNTQIDKFIYNGRLTYMQSYLQKKLLPFWKDRLTQECIEFVIANIEKGIKATNEFIAKEDLINQVYFANPRPLTWREQLIDAGIPFDDE